MMTADYPNAREVTPANLRREQQARDAHRTKIKVVESKLRGIEKKIVELNKRGAEPEIIRRWRESWEYTNRELSKLKGK